MTKLTPTLLRELREKSGAATPGPWQERFWRSAIEWHDGKIHMSIAAHGPLHKADDAGVTATGKDMAHIASCDPTTVLTLLDALDAAREALVWARDCGCDGPFCKDDPDEMCGSCRADTALAAIFDEEG